MNSNDLVINQFNGIVTNKPITIMDKSDLFICQNFIFNNGELQSRGGCVVTDKLDSKVRNILSQEHGFRLPLVLTEKSIYRINDIDIKGRVILYDPLKIGAFKDSGSEVFSVANFNSVLTFASTSEGINYFFNYGTAPANSLDVHLLEPVVSNVYRTDSVNRTYIYKTTVTGAKIIFKFFNTLFLANTTEVIEKIDATTKQVIDRSTVVNQGRIRWCSFGLSPITDINTIPPKLRVADNIVEYVWDASDARSTSKFLDIPDNVSEIVSATVTADGVLIYLYDGSCYILNSSSGGMNLTRLSNQLGIMTNKKSTTVVNEEVFGISYNGLFKADKVYATKLITDYVHNWNDILNINNVNSDVSVDLVNNNTMFLCNVRAERILPGTNYESTILNMNNMDKKITVCTYPHEFTAIARQSSVNFDSKIMKLDTWNDMLNYYNADVWSDLPEGSWKNILTVGSNVFDFDISANIFGTSTGEIGLFNIKTLGEDIDIDGNSSPIRCGLVTQYGGSPLMLSKVEIGVRFTNITGKVNCTVNSFINNLKNGSSVENVANLKLNKSSKFGLYDRYSLGLKRVSCETPILGIKIDLSGVTFNLSDISISVDPIGSKIIK